MSPCAAEDPKAEGERGEGEAGAAESLGKNNGGGCEQRVTAGVAAVLCATCARFAPETRLSVSPPAASA